MARRRSIISLQLVLTFATGIFMLTAEAIQLGDIRTHSALGQPLDATVGVWLTANDKSQPLRLKVSPDVAYRADSNMAAMVAGMRAEIVTTANGTPYIQLRSNAAINEPVLAFRVKVYVGENAVMRNYSLALNPAPPVRRTAAKRRAPTGAPITDANYTVNGGDTLWGIARRVGRTTGVRTGDLVNRIFADNPHAFVNGDRDRLIRGAALRLPLASNTTLATEPSVPEPVVTTTGATMPATTTDAEPVADTATTASSQPAVTTATQAAAPANVESRPAVDWRARDPQLAAELERLRLKYRALKQQYDTQHRSVDAAIATSTSTPAAEQTTVPEADDTSERNATTAAIAPEANVVTTEAAAPDMPSVEDGANVVTDVRADSRPAAAGMSTAMLIAIICGGLALLALLAIALRKGRAALKKRQFEVAHHAREADFKAEVARKAANRVQMESEVQRMLANRGTSDVVAAPLDSTTAVGGATRPGTDAEIDQNIAHGRYNEAESQLIAVIAANPKNYSAKLRLLEVYYMIEEVDSFCDVADDLHVNHRADLSDDEWRRVIRMGKVTAPDRMPFSGPRALDTRDEAS